MSNKRSHIDIDPDYEDVTDHQNKRQRVLEKDAKEATVKKIESIIKCQFEGEIHRKEAEINMVDQRLNQARLLMDRLRACIVASQYSSTIPGSRDRSQPPSIHPTVKKNIGKAPATVTSQSIKQESQSNNVKTKSQQQGNTKSSMKEGSHEVKSVQSIPASSVISPDKMADTRGSRFKIKKKIIVGNVSKFIPIERREVNDQSTHKWMLYVRGPKDKPNIDSFVKKVWFFLHPSYKPNDLVEIIQPPFHLTRRGWGEFPVRVQLHFRDQRNKRVDIIHNLKLDKTCTGLQTLGAETVVEVELEREIPRSDSPQPVDGLSKVLSSKSKQNSSTMVNTTIENLSNHGVCLSENTLNFEPMEVDGECTNTTEAKSLTNGKDSHSEDIKNQDSAQSIDECDTVTVKNTNNSNTDCTPKVIHLKAKDVNKGDVCKNVTVNHSKTGTNSTSSESPLPKQTGVLYMRCKDQQGNLLLLPYKLGPPQPAGKIASDSAKTINVEISKESSASNKSPLPTTSPTSTPAKNVQPSAKLGPSSIPPSTPSPGASKPPTTNLVLKVTPTGLKLVPADSESPAAAPPVIPASSSPVQGAEGAGRQKLKSLLNSNPISKIPAGQTPVAKPVQSFVTSAVKPGSQKAAVMPKQSVSNVKLVNHTVPNLGVKQQQTSPETASQSLVLANIGDKQYLLKVVSGGDNQVPRVPNKPVNTPLSSHTTLLGSALTQTKPPLPQKSIYATDLYGTASSHSSGKASSLSSEQKSKTFSFGSSPFSLQASANQKTLLYNHKAIQNHVALTSEKKIHVWKNKKIKDILNVTEEVKPLNLSDYPDLLSVIRATVRRHPVVKEVVDRSQHPYCAHSTEEWLNWNIGKRRASEWQRASSVRNFIQSRLKGETSFKGEQLWTTRQIMSWSRLHAFSPHHLENLKDTDEVSGSSGINSVSEKHSPVSTARSLSSLSDHCSLRERVDKMLSEIVTSDSSDEDIDILSVELPKVKLKSEAVDTVRSLDGCEILPPSDEAVFVQDTAQQIGVKFQPTEIEPSVQGPVAEEMVYAVMSRLAEDILREAYSVTRSSSKGSENDLKAEDVFKALGNMSVADFLTNRHLGVHDNTVSNLGVR